MDEQRVREIIAEEIGLFFNNDRYIFQREVEVANGRNIILGESTGTKIGTSATQKLGFFNVTPVIQQTGTSAPTGQTNDLDSEARTAINQIRNRLINLGLIT